MRWIHSLLLSGGNYDEKVGARERKLWKVLVLAFVASIVAHQPAGFTKPKDVGIDSPTRNQLSHLFMLLSRNTDFFKRGRLTNKSLIRFGIYSNWDNNYQVFKKIGDGGSYRLSAKYVEARAATYFGREVKHASVDGWAYKNGYYTGAPGDFGEGHRVKVIKLTDIGKGLYKAYADFYSFDDNRSFGGDKMILKKVSSKGKTRFIVLEYLRTWHRLQPR